jgi:glycosyltransferase involved in cell wall biosynthesis
MSDGCSIPDFSRDDVIVEKLSSIGLSRSRNTAISKCSTDLLLLADDDLTFNLPGIEAMRSEFESNPEISIATGCLTEPSGKYLKPYPPSPLTLSLKNSGFIGSPEVMIRMDFLRSTRITFDERFGVGSDHPSGEEYIFITDAMKLGADVRFIGHTIAAHPPMSTGSNWSDLKIMDARRRVLKRVWGKRSPIVLLGFAVRKRKLMGLKTAVLFSLGLPLVRKKPLRAEQNDR